MITSKQALKVLINSGLSIRGAVAPCLSKGTVIFFVKNGGCKYTILPFLIFVFQAVKLPPAVSFHQVVIKST